MDHEKTVTKPPHIDPEDMDEAKVRDEAHDKKSEIKCKYMRAAHGYSSGENSRNELVERAFGESS